MVNDIFILIFISVVFKFITKMINFNTYDFHIKKAKEFAILSLLIIIIIIVISEPIYLLIVKKYFMNVSSEIKIFLQGLAYLMQLSLVLATVIINKEGIYSVGITKNNILKSILTGSFLGIIHFISIKNTYITNNNIDIVYYINSFVSFFIVGFVEEVVFRGYLQNRLISWIGTIKGYSLTAVIFAFSHLPNRLIIGGMNFNSALLSCVELIPSGLLLGYIMIKTKNIVAGSIFHTFIDWTQTILFTLG
ncbi:CPBP family intramembrane glutamic endopeptidase [Clostridium akagii]|uniref:CPBP family intramembrane glutamic endopeptidase n=1 Tax=Clostridium akagii TaxID=91623 RepID=UPI0004798EF7|nr:CPBP family intramembrane glutamic endopeptidase [Clostridium akagii]